MMFGHFGIKELFERIFFREPALPYFFVYLDTQMLKMQDSRGLAATLGATFVGIFGLCASVLAALVGNSRLSLVLGVFTVIGVLAFGLRYASGKKREMDALSELELHARPLLRHLHDLKARRRLHNYLAGGVGELLDQGARHWIECRQALDSAVWVTAGSDSVWMATRHKALAAMDASMLRLILATQQFNVAGTEFLSASLDPAIALVEEMREMSRTAKRMTEKLMQHGGTTAYVGSEIQDALAEMKRLEAVQDEIQRMGHSDS